MPPKSKKSRANSSRPAKKTAKQKPAKKRSSSVRTFQAEVDILSPAAMENLYYIAHNAADCLEFRGFGLQNSKKKKKKKGKGRKKKSKGKK
ncbi:small lysine-rich protein 1 [Gadus macrocephalus]|uniref:small lysine-rich protein 1 n=1 Tax=Gadus macrocephalus TaxID=80720 RepID=UPI0028CB63E5|nr:small lysine-rich protein 1 [Gadus macrocephalus]